MKKGGAAHAAARAPSGTCCHRTARRGGLFTWAWRSHGHERVLAQRVLEAQERPDSRYHGRHHLAQLAGEGGAHDVPVPGHLLAARPLQERLSELALLARGYAESVGCLVHGAHVERHHPISADDLALFFLINLLDLETGNDAVYLAVVALREAKALAVLEEEGRSDTVLVVEIRWQGRAISSLVLGELPGDGGGEQHAHAAKLRLLGVRAAVERTDDRPAVPHQAFGALQVEMVAHRVDKSQLPDPVRRLAENISVMRLQYHPRMLQQPGRLELGVLEQHS
mmetsp:Transcript_111801/g.316539  ORF Transcript_111801/g.316539 Transcript_111801/m.316539 type:complete len:282 (+) Transcript_111801:92-937(+)|eukprot:CAMPEP_0179309542 /NCGR_PEP_ID=MMETSP0797-20121207/51707_1 /TAXON_ID=47934 /ORGANISM="Dinophysis acuminata, Strain DAEP01" /LENGTH=281 /DNA_ID=CAMNT_0021019253 /DNA_START=84 /DNA_END=929 /DNA_ORIENTATION=+